MSSGNKSAKEDNRKLRKVSKEEVLDVIWKGELFFSINFKAIESDPGRA